MLVNDAHRSLWMSFSRMYFDGMRPHPFELVAESARPAPVTNLLGRVDFSSRFRLKRLAAFSALEIAATSSKCDSR